MKTLNFTWILAVLFTGLLPMKAVDAEPSLLVVPDLEAPVESSWENSIEALIRDAIDIDGLGENIFGNEFSVQSNIGEAESLQNQQTNESTGIRTNSPPSLFIEVSRDSRTWQTFDIQSDKAHLFNCERYRKIRVLTDGNATPAEYDVACRSRYVVYWNSELARWDIATIVRD